MTPDQVMRSMPSWYWSAVQHSARSVVKARRGHQKALWRLFLRLLTLALDLRVKTLWRLS